MRAVLLLLCKAVWLAFFPGGARADAVVNGGVSSGGRYEVRLWTDPLWDPADFELRIYDTATGVWMEARDLPLERDRRKDALQGMVALWQPAADRVAVWDRGGMGLWILWLDGSRLWAERVPPLWGGWRVDWLLCWEGGRLRVRVVREKPGRVAPEVGERWLGLEGGVRWVKE